MKAMRLDVVANKMPPWTEKEEDILRELYWSKTPEKEIMKALPGRTWSSIQSKARRMSRVKRQKPRPPRRGKEWNKEEIAIIKEHWNRLDWRVIQQKYLPHRSKPSLEGAARRLGLTTPRKLRISNYHVIQQLIRERKILNLSRLDVAEKSGYSECQIAEWERGTNAVALPKFIDWAQTLGFDVVLVPMEE